MARAIRFSQHGNVGVGGGSFIGYVFFWCGVMFAFVCKLLRKGRHLNNSVRINERNKVLDWTK